MGGMSAQDFATEWIEAFNAHDLERILSHYAPDVELVSPIYRQFTSGETDRVVGRERLRAYFGTAPKHYPDLHFTLLEIADG